MEAPFWLAIVWRFPWIQDTLCMHLQFKLIFIWNGSLIQNLKNKQLKAFDDRPTLRRTKLLFLRQNWRFCFKWPFSGAHFPLNQITHNNSWISLPLHLLTHPQQVQDLENVLNWHTCKGNIHEDTVLYSNWQGLRFSMATSCYSLPLVKWGLWQDCQLKASLLQLIDPPRHYDPRGALGRKRI